MSCTRSPPVPSWRRPWRGAYGRKIYRLIDGRVTVLYRSIDKEVTRRYRMISSEKNTLKRKYRLIDIKVTVEYLSIDILFQMAGPLRGSAHEAGADHLPHRAGIRYLFKDYGIHSNHPLSSRAVSTWSCARSAQRRWREGRR